MKISVRSGKTLLSYLSGHCRPYLNGKYLPDCVMVDTWAGRAVVYRTSHGGLVVRDGVVQTCTVIGDIGIKPPPFRTLLSGWFWRGVWRAIR